MVSLTNVADVVFLGFIWVQYLAYLFIKQTQMKAQQAALAPGEMKTLYFQLVTGDMVAAKRSCQG
jgi:hypothetical protein